LKKKSKELRESNLRELGEGKLSEEEKKILEGGELIDIDYARELLNTPTEKLAELTLSEISQIVSDMKIQDSPSVDIEQVGAHGKEDFQGDIREKIRLILVNGLRKIWNNKVDELTDEERKIILRAFQSLDEKRKRTPQEDRLHRVMSAMVRVAFQHYRPR